MPLYETVAERHAHEEAIESLVGEMHLPEDVVRTAYERELERLKDGVRVKDFLVLFTVRRVRESLRAA